MSLQHGERRIGRRQPPFPPLEIQWSTGRRRGLLRRPSPASTAQVVDLSVSGASVEVEPDDDIGRGSKIPISYQGHTGVALVTRVVGTGSDGRIVYGVRFTEMSEGLTKEFHAYLARHRPNGAVAQS